MQDCKHEKAFTGTSDEGDCGAQCSLYPSCRAKVGGYATYDEAAKAFHAKYGTKRIAIG